MNYFLAPSLKKLRDQINELWPNRDKKSDGWIGDAAHQARKSDHNPDYSAGGIVRAIDVDKDGIDADMVVNNIIKDARVAYVIWQRKLWQRSTGWIKYTGANAHNLHFHVSIRHDHESGHSTKAWNIGKKGNSSTDESTLEQLADRVLRGEFGNGEQRKKALGERYDDVQAIVRQRLNVGGKKTNDQIATEVIQGKWGNGSVRRERLTKAGYNYSDVQAIVNRRLK